MLFLVYNAKIYFRLFVWHGMILLLQEYFSSFNDSSRIQVTYYICRCTLKILCQKKVQNQNIMLHSIRRNFIELNFNYSAPAFNKLVKKINLSRQLKLLNRKNISPQVYYYHGTQFAHKNFSAHFYFLFYQLLNFGIIRALTLQLCVRYN